MLETDEGGSITGYKMRCRDTKATAVKAFQAMGYKVFASGDSYNDLGMIKAADAGCLIHPPASVKEENPGVFCAADLDELYKTIVEISYGDH